MVRASGHHVDRIVDLREVDPFAEEHDFAPRQAVAVGEIQEIALHLARHAGVVHRPEQQRVFRRWFAEKAAVSLTVRVSRVYAAASSLSTVRAVEATAARPAMPERNRLSQRG